MPGRGRGLHKKPTEIPKISAEQIAILESDSPAVPEQFKDAEEAAGTVNPTKPKSSQESKSTDSIETVEKNSTTGDKKLTSDKEPMPTNAKEPTPTNAKEPTPTNTKEPTPTNGLNPTVKEFVPTKSTLNISAPVFVPRSLEPVLVETPDGPSLEDPPNYSTYSLTTADILNGFVHKSSGEVPLLQAAATMLIEASLYPASFDTHLSILAHLIQSTPPTSDVLEDMAEMLVSWGFRNVELRYTAIHMNDYMCKLSIKDVFRPKLFMNLQKRYMEVKGLKDYTNHEDVSKLINVSFFLAEMFSRVRINDQAVWVLGSAVMECVFLLLDIFTDETVISACNLLKLTGYVLERKTPKTEKFDPVYKLDTAITNLRMMSVDEKLTSRTSNIIMSLLVLKGNNWGMGTPPYTKKNLLVDKPVEKAEEWEDYVDESGNVIEGVDYYEPDVCFDDQHDPNVDEEMMKEYEDFVKDFEDHLMMQEFGQS